MDYSLINKLFIQLLMEGFMKCLQKPFLLTIVTYLFVLFFALDASAQVFFPGPTLDVGKSPNWVITADFNGDLSSPYYNSKGYIVK